MARVVDPEEMEAQHLRQMVELRSARILEIGCGDGRLTACYAKDAAHVLGVDIKTEDLVTARSILPVGAWGEFTVANAQLLPCAPASFDIVLFARSL
jgi:ubiquinone/menaquinone biosynthesis C-methylase UbiE